MPQERESDVQIIPLYPEVQLIPIKRTEPNFPSELVPVLIIPLGRTTNTTRPLTTPIGAEWIVGQSIAESSMQEIQESEDANEDLSERAEKSNCLAVLTSDQSLTCQ
jgi:hypothetical protein